jgi:hypothetical protein
MQTVMTARIDVRNAVVQTNVRTSESVVGKKVTPVKTSVSASRKKFETVCAAIEVNAAMAMRTRTKTISVR